MTRIFRSPEYRFTVVLMPRGRRVTALSASLLLLSLGVVSAQARPPNDNARDRAILEIQKRIESGNLPAAREQLTASTKELGSDAGFDNLSGVIEAQAHHYSAAEAEFKRAIERQPRFTAAYLNLGRLYQENVSTDSQANQKALVIYDTVLSYEPGNAEANYQSALLLLEAGKYQASLTRVSRLPKTARESAQALSISCADYVGLGDHKNTSTVLAQLQENRIEQWILELLRDDDTFKTSEGRDNAQPFEVAVMIATDNDRLARARVFLIPSLAILKLNIAREILTR